MSPWKPGRLDRSRPLYVAGHRGLVGSAVWRHLESEGFTSLVGRTSADLDLCDRRAVFDFFEAERPPTVVLAAAMVGGIRANASRPVDFLSQNLQIQVNVMDAALSVSVPRLLFLGSSCIYPRLARQPITESALMTGNLEKTNEAYAIAKIAGILQVQGVRRQHGLPWISAMPTNIYGPGDNFSSEDSHVLAAFVARYVEAEQSGTPRVTNWGTGTPRREFMHVDDLAAACLHLLEGYDDDIHINVGVGQDISVSELAELVAEVVGYKGLTAWDESQPDGTPRKLLDVSKLAATGFRARTPLREGVESTVAWFRESRRSPE